MLFLLEAHSQERDSLKFYRDIEKYAKKRKGTYTLYKAIFNLPDTKTKKTEKQKTISYNKYKGRIIRQIQIYTLDPFGYSVRDTLTKPKSLFQKGGNALHKRTMRFAISNQLLFKKNQPLDPLALKESERILRQSDYVKDVWIQVVPVKNNRDSVDIIIHEQDLWSKQFGVAYTSTKQALVFNDKNFAGLAHKLESGMTNYNDPQKLLFNGRYTIPYIRNTFISLSAYYNTDDNNYLRGITINRPFVSTLTKYAGGFDIYTQKNIDSAYFNDSLLIQYSVKRNVEDVWFGKSFPVRKGLSDEERNTNFIAALRFANTHYDMKPPPSLDTANLYNRTQLYLATFGISNRNYYRDYYIYRYGIAEDVPIGRLFTVSGGYEAGDLPRTYLSAVAGLGNHIDRLGYLSLMTGYGTYIRHGQTEQGVWNSSLGYFTDLLTLGRWKVRQFVKTRLIIGIERNPNERININNEAGLKGFESDFIFGTSKALITFQTQAYAPWNVLGFRFAPVLIANFGTVGSKSEPLFTNRVYQSFGIGLLVKNELLVVNTFQFIFGIYPFFPGSEGVKIKLNPLKTYDLTFSDFVIGKPGAVAFE